jgi:membrane dipeptidase
MSADPDIIVDAHEDIAYNAILFNRDFTRNTYLTRKLEAGQPLPAAPRGIATSGLPNALLGRVGVLFGTLFVAPSRVSSGYEPSYETPAQAYKQALDQLDVYYRLAESDHSAERIVLVTNQAALESVLATWADGIDFAAHKLGIVLAMESADSIPEPKAFEEWYERGVRSVGLAWHGTRYSGGTGDPGPLTTLGRELLEVMESFNAILDLSHMAEEAYLEAVERYGGPIIASHSNPRKFCNTDRHLSDFMIRQLAERDGVMNIVLYSAFLRDDWSETDPKSKTPLETVIAAIDHVCQVTGSARHVGIGSDFDGGFGVKDIPAELDTVTDLQLIGPRLAAWGYTPEDVKSILGGNMLRILRTALPR